MTEFDRYVPLAALLALETVRYNSLLVDHNTFYSGILYNQDREGHYANWWIPSLWYCQRGLPDDQGMLRGPEKTGCYSKTVTAEADVQSCHRGNQAQVHRHIVQLWAWSFPDYSGEGKVLRSAQGLKLQSGRGSIASICFSGFGVVKSTSSGAFSYKKQIFRGILLCFHLYLRPNFEF